MKKNQYLEGIRLDTVRSCAPASQMQGAGLPVAGARLWVGTGRWRMGSGVWWRSGAGGLAPGRLGYGLWAVTARVGRWRG